jgi:hypothetical protein
MLTEEASKARARIALAIAHRVRWCAQARRRSRLRTRVTRTPVFEDAARFDSALSGRARAGSCTWTCIVLLAEL